MPVSFRVHPRHSLVYVRYSGTPGVEETLRAMQSCLSHPDFRLTFRHLVDFSAVTDFRRDHAELMRLAARMPDLLDDPQHGVLLVYYAPTPEAQALAQAVMKSYHGVSHSVLVVVDEPQKALDCLGLDGVDFAALAPVSHRAL